MKATVGARGYRRIARFSIFLITAALVAAMVGCVSSPTEYDLTASSTEGGQVSSPGEGTFTYGEGEVVRLVAVAENGYRFANWAGDVSTIADPSAAATTITMNDNCSVTANFYENPLTYYTLTVEVNGNGSTSPSAGQHTYAAGTVVSITAVPASGYQFVNWTGSMGTVAIAATTTVTMNADHFMMANFKEEVTSPDPNFDATIRGPIDKEGGLPSDLQRHNFFSGTT